MLGVLALVAASLAIPFRSGAVETTPSLMRPEPEPEPGPGLGVGGGGWGHPWTVCWPAHRCRPLRPAGSSSPTSPTGKTRARAFTVPFTAPAPLPAGDPAVIVKLADGSFVAFDAVCTHAGCTVEWDQADRLLICPCHDAVFDPAADAAVLAGPARQPLAPIPIRVDQASGAISLGA